MLRVLDFFEMERRERRRYLVREARKRASKATGVGVSTIKRIVAAASPVPDDATQLQDDGASGDDCETRGRRQIIVDDFLNGLIKSKVHSFNSKKEHPTVDKVLALCKEDIAEFPDMGRTTFWKTLRSVGFRYGKTEGNTKLMMERNDIVAWRCRYLREIREARGAGKPIVYLDETWVNAHHTVSRKWYDRGVPAGAQQPSEAPSGKGQRLIILHAGSKDGFVPNCQLVFVGNTKSHDYHCSDPTHSITSFYKRMRKK